MNIYLISGLGASCEVFEKITFPKNYNIIPIEWLQPNKKESLNHFAKRMAESIDTTKPFHIIGLSFGGIIAQEINSFLNPEKVILISSIKSESEKPKIFSFAKFTRLHKLIPTRFFTSDKLVSYTFFRKLYSRRLPDIQKYFIYRDSFYLKWSFDRIVNWKPIPNTKNNIFHIHGTKDVVFNIHNIENVIKIEGGSHIMIINKHKLISDKIVEVLK